MNRSSALPRSAASLLALSTPLLAEDTSAHRGSLDGIQDAVTALVGGRPSHPAGQTRH